MRAVAVDGFHLAANANPTRSKRSDRDTQCRPPIGVDLAGWVEHQSRWAAGLAAPAADLRAMTLDDSVVEGALVAMRGDEVLWRIDRLGEGQTRDFAVAPRLPIVLPQGELLRDAALAHEGSRSAGP
jgi:hypothetical protein